MNVMTNEFICDKLGISMQTLNNWIRLGRIAPPRLFDENDLEKFSAKLKELDKLKSRRNKINADGGGVYKNYIDKSSPNLSLVEKIVKTAGTGMSDGQISAVIAFFAEQLLRKRGHKNKYKCLIEDLAENIHIPDDITEYDLEFVPGEDTLGFLYISLRSIKSRKEKGVYFTPSGIAKTMSEEIGEFESVLDPCCGTGNFYLNLDIKNPSKIYGRDTDGISVKIARINLALNYDMDINELYENIRCENTLTTEDNRKYDLIIGNPPWGYRFSSEEQSLLKRVYKTKESSGIFMEWAVSHLNQGGIMAFVAPEAIMTVGKHKKLREILMDNFSPRAVVYCWQNFHEVSCPGVVLIMEKSDKFTSKGMKVITKDGGFIVNSERNISSDSFSFNMTDNEYFILHKITTLKNAVYLKDNAEFGLGIVTGDNNRLISKEKSDNNEPILRGRNIKKYRTEESGEYIEFAPEKFQQTARTEIYRSEEKILYKFISDEAVFAYDNMGILPLNSANVLIPHIKGLSAKYILCVLNSSAARFFFQKTFCSVKMLKSHIESLPIPIPDEQSAVKLEVLAEVLVNEESPAAEKMADEIVCGLYGLSKEEMEML